MPTLLRDFRHAFRALLRSPGFTAVAAITFAVGIGANSAVFSVYNGAVLTPLPYPDPDRIAMLWMDNRREGIREDIASYPIFVDWREASTSFESMAAYTPAAFVLSGADEPERLVGAQATASFFDVFRVAPILGGLYTANHERPGEGAVVLISERLWRSRFGGAPDVLGRTISLDGQPHEVLGVMPASFDYPSGALLWRPLAPSDNLRNARTAFWLPVIGRLKPGITVDRAQLEMNGIGARLEETYPEIKGFGVYVVGLHRQMIGDLDRSLAVLLGAVTLVLLIACVNIGHLMLGRAAARRKELAIRSALGAGRSRLVRQILTESMTVALFGTAAGLLLALWATDLLVSLGGDTIPRPEAIRLDARVLLFTAALAVAAALLAGLLPALAASRLSFAEHLREGRREGTGGTSGRMRGALIAAEVALAFVLLAGSALLVQTLWTIRGTDRGFDPHGVVTMRVSLPAAAYPGPAEVRSFYVRLLDRLRTLPGVEAAASGTAVLQPLLANSGVFSIEGRPLPPPQERVEYPIEIVSPGFFDTLGAPIVAGRGFTEGDHAEAPRAVVINEALARHAWPGQDPLGRRLRQGAGDSNAPWMTVVGVVRDMRRADVRREIRPEVYMSTLQVPARTQMLLVRTAGDPAAVVGAVRRELQALDARLPLFEVSTLDAQLARTLAAERFRAVLLTWFAGIAVLLAAVGIYGVTAHAAGERRHEVGIRMALGARPRDVLRLLLTEHLRPAAAGVVLGFAGALVLSGSLDAFVFGVTATDPLTYASMGAALLAVALLGCWLPARRATRVDPVVAMRAG